MGTKRHVRFYLEQSLLESAERGQHNFIGLIVRVLERAGHSVEFLSDKSRPKDDDGLSFVHMARPLGRRGLTFRRVYHYPFWQIEQTERRWAWDVARDRFNAELIDPNAALRFQAFWRNRLYGNSGASAEREDVVYVPLQGKLTVHRSFQTMSPIQMLETTLRLDQKRRVIATLHPKERYQARDYHALEKLEAKNPRLHISSVAPAEILPICSYVVTQNSAVAFDGYLFDTPAVLFAKIDFHHIAQSLTRMPDVDAFARVLDDRVDFARYLYWFWQDRSINAGRKEACDKIHSRLTQLGWPV